MTRVVALVLALVSTTAHAASRTYEGPLATTAPTEGPAPVEAPAAVDAPDDAAPSEAPAASPPPPRVTPDALPRARRPPLVIAGVATISLGLAGYVAMVAGLGIGAAADTDLAPLGARMDVERRRELLDRGRFGNRLAIGAGVAAAVAVATGIALVVIGRRRAHMSARARAH